MRRPRRVRVILLALILVAAAPVSFSRTIQTHQENLATQTVKARQEDLQRRMAARLQPWLVGNDQPTRLLEFPVEVIEFVEEKLLPRLRAEQKTFLKRAERKKWPTLARSIAILADRYPVYPPVRDKPPILNVDDLPKRWEKILDDPRLPHEVRREVRDKEGRWPHYPLAVVNLASRTDVRFRLLFGGGGGSNIFPWGLPSLGASRPGEFPPETEAFLTQQLPRKVAQHELDQLKKLEGYWPTYPRYLHELARKHKLVIPGMSLPGPAELWENARKEMPEVPGLPLPKDDVGW